MDRIYASRVQSNVKGGVDVALGPKTLIVGPSGSGKSAIVQSLELALGSFASDIVGRSEVAREIDLMTLAPSGGVLTSRVELDNGEAASYEAGGSKKKARWILPGGLDADAIFPMRALREALLGSAATTRKFFLDQTATELTFDELEGSVPGPLREFFLTASFPFRGARLPASGVLLETLAAAKKRASEDAKAAKTTKAAVSVATRDLPPEPSDLDFMRARSALEKAQADLMAFNKAIGAIQTRQTRIGGFEHSLAAADAALERLGNTEDAIVKALTEARTNFDLIEHEGAPEALPAAYTTATKVMEAMAEQEAEECLVCGTAVTDALSAQIAERYNAILDANALSRDHEARRAKALATLNAAEKVAQKWNADVELIENNRAHAFEQIEQLTAENEAATFELTSSDEAALIATLEEARSSLSALEQAKAAWASVTKVTDAAVDVDVSSAEWKKLALVLEKLVGSFLSRGVDTFVQRVNGALPRGEEFGLRLQDGDREVCQYGLLRGTTLHTALSGLEWARVTAAMATVATKASPLSIIIPEDRGWDAEILSATMAAWSTLPHQVVIATTTQPAFVPKGWTLIKR
jgi:energy-coupling factor transporter ATP-binding protein EcfA2